MQSHCRSLCMCVCVCVHVCVRVCDKGNPSILFQPHGPMAPPCLVCLFASILFFLLLLLLFFLLLLLLCVRVLSCAFNMPSLFALLHDWRQPTDPHWSTEAPPWGMCVCVCVCVCAPQGNRDPLQRSSIRMAALPHRTDTTPPSHTHTLTATQILW